jgi:tRNA1Val (adenine37-N6)-methyltransferase
MMAQRFPNARIDAIDIDGKTVEVERRHFNNSPWSDRLNVFHSSLQQFSLNNKGYDLVISNPPYFSNSLRNNDPRKRIARHDDTLPIEQLFKDSFAILSPYGCSAIIIPFSESSRVISHASTNGLRCFSSIAIHNHATDTPKRIVLQFKTNKHSDDKTQTAENDLILRNSDNTYTDRYQNIISPFLLG